MALNVETTFAAPVIPANPSPIRDNVSKARKTRLQSIVERIEPIEAERDKLSEDIREIYKEAKSKGFDVQAIRKVVWMRMMVKAKREEAVLDTYMTALNMI